MSKGPVFRFLLKLSATSCSLNLDLLSSTDSHSMDDDYLEQSLPLTLFIYHLFFFFFIPSWCFFFPSFILSFPAPKFLQPSPDSLHTSVLAFIKVGCTDKRISLLRLHQSCHVRSVKISGGGLGRRKCLKVSHKNSFIHQDRPLIWDGERDCFMKVPLDSIRPRMVQLNVTEAAVWSHAFTVASRSFLRMCGWKWGRWTHDGQFI